MAIWDDIWHKVKAISTVKSWVGTIYDDVKNLPKKIEKTAEDIVDDVVDEFEDAFDDVKNLPKKIEKTAEDIVEDAFDVVVDEFEDAFDEVGDAFDNVVESVQDIYEEVEDVYDVVKVIPIKLGNDIGYLGENAAKFSVRQSIMAGENISNLSKQIAKNTVILSKQVAKNSEEIAKFTGKVGVEIGKQIGKVGIEIGEKIEESAVATFKNTLVLGNTIIDGFEDTVYFINNIGPIIGSVMDNLVIVGVPIISIVCYEGVRSFLM